MVRRFDEVKHGGRLRALVLIALAVACASRGMGYVLPSSPGGTDYVAALTPIVPIQAWAAVWLLVAVMLLAGLACPRWAKWPMSGAAALWGAWGFSYMWATVALEADRAWLTGSLFVSLVVLTVAFTHLMEPRKGGR